MFTLVLSQNLCRIAKTMQLLSTKTKRRHSCSELHFCARECRVEANRQLQEALPYLHEERRVLCPPLEQQGNSSFQANAACNSIKDKAGKHGQLSERAGAGMCRYRRVLYGISSFCFRRHCESSARTSLS